MLLATGIAHASSKKLSAPRGSFLEEALALFIWFEKTAMGPNLSRVSSQITVNILQSELAEQTEANNAIIRKKLSNQTSQGEASS